MDETLHRLNAFLRPKTNAISERLVVTKSATINKGLLNHSKIKAENGEEILIRAAELVREQVVNLEAQEAFRLVCNELVSMQKLLIAIKKQYDAFLETGDDIILEDAAFALPMVHSIEEQEEYQRNSDQLQRQQEKQNNQDEEKKKRKDQVLKDVLEQEEKGSRIIKSYLKPKPRPSSPQIEEQIDSRLINLKVDWERIRECSQSLVGVLEVIPVYSRAFEELCKSIGSDRPELASLLLKVWKGHMELLLLIVMKSKKETLKDKSIIALHDENQKMEMSLENLKTLVKEAEKDLKAHEGTKREVRRRALFQNEKLADLHQRERNLLEVQMQVEHKLRIAQQAHEREELELDRASSNEIDLEPPLPGKSPKERPKKSSFGHQENNSEANIEDAEVQHDEEHGNFDKEEVERSKENAQQEQDIGPQNGPEDKEEEHEHEDEDEEDSIENDDSNGFYLTNMFVVEGKEKKQIPTESDQSRRENGENVPEESMHLKNENEIQDDEESENEFDLGNEIVENQDEQVKIAQMELLQLNREIKDVEKVTARKREEKRIKAERQRAQQMITNTDLLLVKEMFSDLISMKHTIERTVINRTTFSIHEESSSHMNWDDTNNIILRHSSPTPRKRKAVDKKQVSKRKNRPASLTSLQIPQYILNLLQGATDLSIFSKHPRKNFSLTNTLEIICRIDLMIIANIRKSNMLLETLASFVYRFFQEELGELDHAEAEFVNFISGLLSYSSSNVGVYNFKRMLDHPMSSCLGYFSALSFWYEEQQVFQSLDGSRWTPCIFAKQHLCRLGCRKKLSDVAISRIGQNLGFLTTDILPGPIEMILLDDVMMLMIQNKLI